jgi:hypothetical protein
VHRPVALTTTVDSASPVPDDDLLNLAPSSILNPAASSVLSREPNALLQSHIVSRSIGSARSTALPSFGGKNFAGVPTHSAKQPTIQPKLTVGAAHDPSKQEADQVAERVMRMSAPVSAALGGADTPEPGGNSIRRAPEEEEESHAPAEQESAEAQAAAPRGSDVARAAQSDTNTSKAMANKVKKRDQA